MRSIASALLLFGIGSFVLNLLNYEFKLLMWVDMWGHSTGNLIRIGMVVAGVILYALDHFVFNKPSADNEV